MKKSAATLSLIGVAIFLVGMILGSAYILTGNSLKGFDKTYFVGHLLNSDGTVNTNDFPEKLALIALLVTMIGLIFSTIGLFIETKGKTRSEKKEYTNSKFLVVTIGMTIGVIASVVLMILVPKETGKDSLKSITWYYVMLGAFIIGAITTIVGVIKAFGNLKKSIIKETTEDVIKKDEF